MAGKEVLGKSYGGWIRPVSGREGEEISEQEQTFSNGCRPQILDVLTIPIMEHKPIHHQRENHLIDSTSLWEKTGILDRQKLPELLDNIPGDLWINGDSSNAGNNDRIRKADAIAMDNSLLLIQPEILTIIVQQGRNPETEPVVRADFEHNGRNYNLAVTDPLDEEKYRSKSHGHALPHSHPIAVDNVYFCISLGENFYDYCYKLVATIIGDTE